MRVLIASVLFLLSFSNLAFANYNQSKNWFYSKDRDERIVIQLLLIFTGDYVAIVDAAFGKRTYDALRQFQLKHNENPDGVLSERELRLLWDQGGSVMEKVGFEFRDDLSTGITLGIPESLFVSMEPTERGTRWIDKNGIIELETLRIPQFETSYEQLYRRLAAENSNRRIEYKFFRNNNFIVSGTNRGKKFYLRMFRTRSDTRGFSLAWDGEVGALMDRVSVAMSNSLSFYDGSEAARSPQIKNQTPPVSSVVPPPKTTPQNRSSGSGYFVTADGHVGTNHHVIEECASIRVAGHGPARLVKVDATNDLAIIQVETTKSHTVAKFRSAPVRRGEEIFVLGFPFSDLLGNNLTISEGIVSSLAGIGGDVRNFHLSAPVQPGNSGGPVLDASGDLVGTVVAKLDAMKTLELAGTLPENVNFAVHGNMMAILMSSANIEPSYAAPTDDMSAADVSSKAESFTVQVLCN
jgi:serine protease Do